MWTQVKCMWHTFNILYVRRLTHNIHNAIRDSMYALAWESEHDVWKKQWYILTLRASLGVDLYMTCENYIFVADVIVTNVTWKIVVTNVINRLASAIAKLNTIVKIYKYKKIDEKHHFIPMSMNVHGTPRCDINCFIRECVRFFHNRPWRGHLSLYFYF